MKRARYLKYCGFKAKGKNFEFNYEVDRKKYYLRFQLSSASRLDKFKVRIIIKELGMCFLIDIAQTILPKKIVIDVPYISEKLDFWKKLHKNLSIKKFYMQKLDLAYLDIDWKITRLEKKRLPFRVRGGLRKSLIGITGGKDSVACIKLFKDKIPFDLFSLDPTDTPHLTKAYAALSQDFKSITIESNYYDFIVNLIKNYGSFNLRSTTAILAFLALLYADQYKWLFLGCEYSSNFGNDIYGGLPVNNQYIKSLDFAKLMNEYLFKYITPDFSYFSPFFGLFEYKIMEIFFSDKKYLDLWTSCNRSDETHNFCCKCHKCAFCYLTALVYTDKKFLSKFFEYDLLKNEKLYLPLMDPTAVKPLECIGEKREVWVALAKIYKQGKDKSSKTMKYFRKVVYPQIKDKMADYEGEIGSLQSIDMKMPEEINNSLKTYF